MDGDFFLVILHILKNICAKFQLIIFGWVTVVYAIQQPDYRVLSLFVLHRFTR